MTEWDMFGLPIIDPESIPDPPPMKPPKNQQHFIHCSRCGKPVSQMLPFPVIVRAFIECPECIKED